MTQAYNLSQLANNLNSSGQLDATDGLVNAVPVANGGTGASSASAARTNLDVPQTGGSGATGTWPISISGSAAQLNGQSGSYYQPALGFTPVQQGGGAGQSTNKIYIGWSSGSALKAQVDATDLGAFVFQSAFNDNSFTGNGYQKLPGGLIMQWGLLTTTSSGTYVYFPISFPSVCINVQVSITNAAGSTSALGTGSVSASNFVLYHDPAAPDTGVYWFAIGW